MDPHHNNMNMNMNQQAHMYAHSYSAYAPPAYHGHTGYTQTFANPNAANIPVPQNAVQTMGGWNAYYQQPGAQGQVGVQGQQTQAVQQQQQQQCGVQSVAAPTEAYEVILPHHHDVLMGRGGKNNQHAGNENLRDMARAMRDRYKASAKKGKSNMSRELVQNVRDLDPPGRFLKRNPVTSDWEDVGDEIAREKVSQVLRDAVSEWTGPKSQTKAAAKDGDDAKGEPPKLEKTNAKRKSSSPSTSRETSPAPCRVSTARSRSNSPTTAAAAATSNTTSTAPPAPAPLPVIDFPTIATRTVTVTDTIVTPAVATVAAPPLASTLKQPLEEQPTSLSLKEEDSPALLPPAHSIPMRSRSNTADSEISLDDIDELELDDFDDTASLDDSASQAASIASSRGTFRRMPVAHVPFTSFRTKQRNRLDRYSNSSLGVSSSDMSISSQLSSRNLGTQLSGRQLVSTGTRQMSSRQLSSRQLSSRQLSSRQLSSRQLSSRQLSSRQLSSRQLSKRGLLSSSMMGESELSLDSLSISGHSKQLSRKNVFMQQYMDMDMGLSDFSVGSFLGEGGPVGEAGFANGGFQRPSVIVEGDLEESFSEHTNNNNNVDPIIIKPTALLDMYASTGVGTSFSNMTVGTFSGHSCMSRGMSSRGLYATGNSMRLESGHSFVGNDLQLDMLDDELFDEYDYMDDADEFSSEFC